MQQAVNFKVVKSFAIREHCVAVLCDECHPKIGLFRTTENEKLFNNSIPFQSCLILLFSPALNVVLWFVSNDIRKRVY